MCETILESICAHARQAAERPCLIERGEVWTYAAYWRMILGFSRRLQSLGVEPGEVVVVAAKQTALFLAAGEAVRLAGAVFAPIEQSIGADRVRALVRMLNARALVADNRLLLIDDQTQLAAIIDAYPAEPNPYVPHRNGGRYPDWEALAADGWDGVYLTDRGQWETRLPRGGPDLYGWDLESCLWLRPSYVVGRTVRSSVPSRAGAA